MTTNPTTASRNAALARLAARPVRTRRLLARWALAEPVWSDVDAMKIVKALTSSGSWPLLASLARLTQSGDPDAPVWLAAALTTHPAVTKLGVSVSVDDLVQSVILGLLESNRSITGVRSILNCARTTWRRGQRWSERTAPLPDQPIATSVPDPYAVIDVRVSLPSDLCRLVEAKAQRFTAAETGAHRWTIHRRLARAQQSIREESLVELAVAA